MDGRSKIFRRIRPHFLVSARKTLVINRGKLGCEIGVDEALNGHRSGASRAMYVAGRDALEVVRQFHPLPLSFEGDALACAPDLTIERLPCRLRFPEQLFMCPDWKTYSIAHGLTPLMSLANGGIMKQSDIFRENAEHCAHLAEGSTNRPTYRRYKRMEAAWRALAHEQDWLDGEIVPNRTANGSPLNIDPRAKSGL
jgi:hypothetical protein